MSPPATVLMVDDEAFNIMVVTAALGDTYQLLSAENGYQALEMLERYDIDLILLDIQMPEMDGYELCQRIKSDDRLANIPVIFLTGKTEIIDETYGLSLGAADYLIKPINHAILLARVKTHIDLHQTFKLVQQQKAHLLQQQELVENIILRMRTVDTPYKQYLRIFLKSLDKTSGDIFLSGLVNENRQYMMLGDFTGHGLPAAVCSPLVAHIFNHFVENGRPITEIICAINQSLEKRLPVNIFMASIFIEYQLDNHSVKIYNYGMPDVLLIGADNQLKRRFPSLATMLGIIKAVKTTEIEAAFTLQPEERLYFFTDGIIETQNAEHHAFGVEQLSHFLCQLKPDTELSTSTHANELEGILNVLYDFSGRHEFDDDLSLIEFAPKQTAFIKKLQ